MMKNIELAIAAENEYLQRKTSGIADNKSLYDYLQVYGYFNLKEYRIDKAIFLLKKLNQEIKEIPYDTIEMEGDTIIVDYFLRHKPYFLWNIGLNRNTAYVPLSCQKIYEDFLMVKPGYDCDPNRGHILSFDGDLDIVMTLPSGLTGLFKYLVEMIANYLKRYTPKTITIDGNDILIDDKKVLGFVFTEDNEYAIGMYHISFADKEDLIKELCPASVKVPGHIDFIDSHNLLNFILQCLQ